MTDIVDLARSEHREINASRSAAQQQLHLAQRNRWPAADVEQIEVEVLRLAREEDEALARFRKAQQEDLKERAAALAPEVLLGRHDAHQRALAALTALTRSLDELAHAELQLQEINQEARSLPPGHLPIAGRDMLRTPGRGQRLLFEMRKDGRRISELIEQVEVGIDEIQREATRYDVGLTNATK